MPWNKGFFEDHPVAFTWRDLPLKLLRGNPGALGLGELRREGSSTTSPSPKNLIAAKVVYTSPWKGKIFGAEKKYTYIDSIKRNILGRTRILWWIPSKRPHENVFFLSLWQHLNISTTSRISLAREFLIRRCPIDWSIGFSTWTDSEGRIYEVKLVKLLHFKNSPSLQVVVMAAVSFATSSCRDLFLRSFLLASRQEVLSTRIRPSPFSLNRLLLWPLQWLPITRPLYGPPLSSKLPICILGTSKKPYSI